MNELFITIHRELSRLVNLYPLLVGIYSLFLFVRKQPPDGGLNSALVIGEGLFAVEVIVGLMLLLFGFQPARSIHVLYGITIVLTLPAIFAFTRGRNTTRESLLYGLGMLFIWGLAERAVMTATGG